MKLNAATFRLKTILLLCIPCIVLIKSEAQRNQLLKQSPAITYLLKTSLPPGNSVSVVVTNMVIFKDFLKDQVPSAKITFEYPLAHILTISVADLTGLKKIVDCPLVQYIDRSQKHIHEELKVPGHNLAVNRINAAQAEFETITGKNITISVKENTFDYKDIDFHGRVLTNARSNNILSTHSNIMATLVGGAGNSSGDGRGVAFGSRLVSTGFNNLFPEPVTYFDSLNISVQNHSYGVDIENYYGVEAYAYDKLIEARPATVMVFSSGNSGTQMATTGIYSNLFSYANLTGNFKMAKNILVVGSVDRYGASDSISSRGPAFDGRLKPDMVAYSPDGTSGAAALVSGSAALIQQALMDKQKIPLLPPSALVKALLLNTADDVGVPGIDFVTGFGNLNTRKALESVENGSYLEGKLTHGQVWTSSLAVPQNISRVKIMLAWLDPTDAPDVSKALVQDLDLEVENRSTGEVFQPWVLNHKPTIDSLKLLPVRKRDSLNNAEQITMDPPGPGDYLIRVIGTKIKNDQSFYLTYLFDTAQHFRWTFPKTIDNVPAGAETVLRWESSIRNKKAFLKFRNTDSNEWSTIDSFIIDKNYVRWQVPDSIMTAQVRLDAEGYFFISDTFFISKQIDFHIAFNCTDSVGFYWNGLKTGLNYQLFALGTQYLEPFRSLQDTFIVLQKKELDTQYLTVAPVLKDHFIGIISPTPDYTQQGVGCFVESLYADVQSDKTIALNLTLATLYNLKKLIFERMEQGRFKLLREVTADQLNFIIIDASPLPGRNIYRVRFQTIGDQYFTSDEVSAFNFEDHDYVLFPNPVAQNTRLNILSGNQIEKPTFQLFDPFGRLILEQKINNATADIQLSYGIAEGVYLYRIEKSGKMLATGKLLIRK